MDRRYVQQWLMHSRPFSNRQSRRIHIDRRTGSLAAMIPEEKIQEVQNASDLLEIISESVVLKKTGKNYQGLCPFHSEKTPSFSVNPSRQIFYCFGCGTGGNVFSFLMKKEGMSFPEAVRDLAKRYGVHIPKGHVSPEQQERMTERDQLFTVNRLAKEFYQARLGGPEGELARNYLKKRQLTQETIDKFELGYAPDGWNHLEGFFRKRRVPISLAEKAGLIVPRKNDNGHYDSFRNRIIFPIFNLSRQVIGFGGRVLDDSLPKYLNSPETQVYNKRRSLYGIDKAKQPAREKEIVYVVEGYLDLMAMYQHGITNSVATLGTALSGEHVRSLRGLVGKDGKVVLVYDSDAAGIKAAERSIEVFAKEFVDAYILVLGEGHDPDSFLFECGADRFNAAAAKALSTISFLIESAIARHGTSLDGKLKVIADLTSSLAAIEDPLARSLYVKALSERIDVDEAAVMEKIREAAGGTPVSRRVSQDGNRPGAPANSFPGRGGKENALQVMPKQHRMESRIVAMLFQFPSMTKEVRDRNILDLFENKALKMIGRLIVEGNGTWTEPAAELAKIESDEVRALGASLAIDEDSWDEHGCMKLLSQFESSRSRRKNALIQDIKAAEAAEDSETLMRLLQKKLDQARKKSRPLKT